MTRRHAIALAVIGVSLVGCASRATIQGRFSDGEALAGTAVGDARNGTVDLHATRSGLTCKGGYEPTKEVSDIAVSLTCNDGATGRAVVHRDKAFRTGKGTFELTNGRRGTLAFRVE